jgi:uncharacterized membrane protein
MAETNVNSRLEAFCDGVFAIALTLLIIEISIPSSESIKTTTDVWVALQHLLPAIFAFLLSFLVIFITWVNHHATLKLVSKSSPAFVYANGFLLLTIVILPFPTALLSEYLFTDHATPAVVIYAAVNALQALSWIILSQTVLKPKALTKDDKSTLTIQSNRRNLQAALIIYILCAVLAFWFPQAIALVLGLIWIGWLFVGVRIMGE